ncbi:M61 family peptidase [Deminuibacter soli]|uniref:M61 family peptidase n=2 Tax=Deminuibacter soli TaxID=2291815 RepID=A0A3E1NFA8_9BACT|nr:M61 family peptidase [Deminuibacter soli]
MATLCCLHTQAQQLVYEFSAPNAVHHEARISVTVKDAPTGAPLLFRMSRSSPGRYATHEFGKNVYDVQVTDESGTALAFTKPDGDVYRVANYTGYVQLTYTLFGNYADGTYAGIDATGYHLNMPATFMWVKGLENAPITIHFNTPADSAFTIATQLLPGKDEHTFTAPGLQYFMDSPVKIGKLKYTGFTLNNPDKTACQFRIAFDGTDNDNQLDAFGEKIKQIVTQAQAVFGETPAYDQHRYTFLASINPYVKGDGMEHRNSTMISIPVAFDGSNRLLGVFAHEFFHCWNVERIRPKTIEPFNFEKSNESDGLWLAEGFTQYYGELLKERAGFTTPADYCNTLSGLINAKQNTPGAKYYSPIESSQHAVFVDAGVSIDQTNYPNMFTSYYMYGGATALALDLTLRSRFNTTLDNYMRALWKKFGKTEIAYTMDGLQQVLAEVTGDKAFAASFFKQYIHGHTSFDYAPLLANAGMQLVAAEPGKAWLGNVQYTTGKNNELIISSNTRRDTPFYMAGIDNSDTLLSVDGREVHAEKDMDAILAAHKPGDVLPVIYKHRDITMKVTVTSAQNPQYKVLLRETADNSGNISPTEQQFRSNWLGKK